MHPAPTGQHQLLDLLVGFLHRRGTTVRYDRLPGDARWNAATRTLTLREDADPITHIELIGDHICMTELGQPSRLGATPRRHLHAVAG